MTQVKASNVREQHLSNINRFLSAFKFSCDSSALSPSFMEESYVYSRECQIPDIYTKTKIPFNKNSIFDVKREHRSKHKNNQVKPNMFPTHPLIVDDKSDLRKVEKKNYIKLNFLKENDLNSMFIQIKEKSWIVHLISGDKENKYGPMNSLKVYTFLKNVYMKMSMEEKEKNSIMIMDVDYDIHYHPETIMEYLELVYGEENNRNQEK